ncbi:MAG: NAD(P)-dependent oxidoreductase [Verrucomicrobia bacterium]|nr:NAD(P)-dependent oxidoreductase [Verrucomicrobiota bacterium]
MTLTNSKYTWFEIPRADPPKRSAVERSEDFGEIYEVFDEETARAQASRCLQCAMPFCRQGCPLENRIPEWLQLVAEGRFLEAAAISGTTSNLPELCARVCPQERLCEGNCALNSRTEPVSIGAIERFINEYAFAHGQADVCAPMPNGRSVAVVGSGPAGLACADELAKWGYAVTVFESQPVAGGLLVNGIPSFKLEKPLIERRLAVLRRRGVSVRTNITVGQDVPLAELLAQFDAVFLGMGAQRAKPLGVPGGEFEGVHAALPFLIQKNGGCVSNLPPIEVADRRVAVVGGGDTAMDCLRTAIRSGARETTCIYRRDLANMPGSRKEYVNAIEEGANFLFLTNPVAVEGDAQGRVTQVRCIRMELGEPDAKGRRSPRPVKGSEFVVPADIVLVAYGFDPVPFPAGSEWSQITLNDWGGVVVDENHMTTLPKVFSGGDQVRGADLVAFAVRDGRRAARGIHRYLTAAHGAR